MKRNAFVRVLGIAISVACLVYVAIRAARVWDQAGPALAAGDTHLRLALALVPITLAYLVAALAWVALLRSFGVPAAILPTSGAYLSAQVGKYLPGNVGHYVGRVVLGSRVGLPASTVALAMTVEFGLLLAIAGLLGLPMLRLIMERLDAAWSAQPATRFVVLGVGAVVIALVLIAILRWRPTLLQSLRQWATQLRAPIGSAGAAGRLGLSVSLSLVVIVLSSCALYVVGDRSQAFSLELLSRVVSLYSVAWIVGALTPGAPGGIGVREAVLIEGLTPLWGASGAVAGALTFRVVTVAADVIALGLGVAALKTIPRQDAARPPLPHAAGASGLPRAAPGSPPRDR